MNNPDDVFGGEFPREEASAAQGGQARARRAVGL